MCTPHPKVSAFELVAGRLEALLRDVPEEDWREALEALIRQLRG